MSVFSILDIKNRIQKFPRKNLINSPTPFYKLENLSRALGGPDVFVKRDDLTGLAFGGNKSRKLEFIIPDVLEKNDDCIITWGSLQSNWCLQTVAAARKFNINPVLILFKSYDLPEEYDGNLLLNSILKADIRIREAEKGKVVKMEDAIESIEEILKEEKRKGYSPYVAPLGGSMVGGSMEKPLGALSYVNAFIEMLEQAESQDLDVDYVVHASGSGGTQAGLTVGGKILNRNIKVLGISVSDDKETFGKEILTIARDTMNALNVNISMEKNDIILFDEYVREGYGIVNKEVSEAIRFVAMEEGIFLDPVYTGKAMTGFIDLIKKGFFNKNDRVVFFHTGGTPALFPNKENLDNFLKF